MHKMETAAYTKTDRAHMCVKISHRNIHVNYII